jgi:hypothetical protein
MRWAMNVACTGEETEVYKVLVGNKKERDHSEDRGVDGRTESKWTLRTMVVGVWSGFTWPKIGTVGGLL